MLKRSFYLNKIKPFIDKPIIKVLTGVRRCGKSVMLEQIKEEILNSGVDKDQIILINFEKLQFDEIRNYKKLHDFIISKSKEVNKKIYVFLDEIQNVENWEIAINSLNVSIDCDIYLTGSNAKLLSGELATHLAGRYVKFDIYPFSFKEFYESYDKEVSKEEAFKHYVRIGGMPFLTNLNFDEELSFTYLRDVFNTVVLKDIIERNKIREPALLNDIISYCVNGMGNSFSASSISKYYKNLNVRISTETVLNYISYCLDAYLLLEAKKEDIHGKETLGGNDKYYLIDHSFKQLLFSNNEQDINLVLENIVYVELRRRGYEVSVGYNKTKKIDFVCHKNGEKIYVQVCYYLASKETIDREFNAYKGISDNYPKYVLSLDNFNMSRDGIIHMNIIDFLLNL